MLGCFKPDFSSLTEEEKNIYKALHCSMCKSLQKNYGNLPTLFLNYDLDFIFLTTHSDFTMNKIRQRCVANPLKKINTFDYDFSKYSELNMIFIYVALLDKKFDNEFSYMYKIFEKLLHKSIKQTRVLFSETLEMDVLAALQNETNLNKIGSLYADLVMNHLKLSDDNTILLKEMIKIMYYFDSFKDYFHDVKHNKFNVFSNVETEDIPNQAKQLIIESIEKINPFIQEGSINQKTLEYSLQSKFNKLREKFIKNRRRLYP